MKSGNITKFYISGLLILAILSFGAFLLLDHKIRERGYDGTVINTSGKQRMLSQRIALFTLKLAADPSIEIQENLKTALKEFEAAHDHLTSWDRDERIKNLTTDEIKVIYTEKPVQLNQKVRDFIRATKSVLNNYEDGIVNIKNKHVVYILEQGPHALLPALDKAVQQYENSSKKALNSLHLYQIVTFFTILVVIILEVIVIFRPMVKMIAKSRRELEYAKREAEKIAEFPRNNPHPLIQVALTGEVITQNLASEAMFPSLIREKFNHPALSGLEEFAKQAEKKSDYNAKMTRECAVGDQTFLQTACFRLIYGKPSLVIYCYEISEMEKVREKARLLEAAIENAKDGVLITKADLSEPGPEIIYANEAFTRMSGYETEEIIGKSPRILQGPDTDRNVLEDLGKKLSAGRSFSGELKNYTKDGIAYWLEINIAPVRNSKGEITHYAAIERDITSRKAFEKELTITKEAAEVANRAKGDFLANMSHELRTPMNGIIGLTELLLSMDMAEDQKELIDAVNSSSQNLLILLNDILDLSKIEAGELTLERVPFDLRRVMRQTVDLLKPLASRKGVILESTINPIVPERVMGDPMRLQQVLNNLINNAIKFTDVGYVRLDVTSHKDRDNRATLQIRVEDTGIGIVEEKQEQIFNKFTQADVSTARKYGGTGLGLAITRELVDIMGGEISLESAEGKGTTFYLNIPIEIAAGSQKTDEEVKTETQESGFDTLAKVMVVDDHPVNLLFMRKVLKKLGFKNVEEAYSGKEAVEKAAAQRFDLVFMDCQMPEMDGFEAAMYIREKEDFSNQIKIIAVTADAMKGARERCIDAGMNDYISKPVDVEKLKSILKQWIPGEDTNNGTFDEEIPSSLITEAHSHVMDWERLDMFTDGDLEEEQQLITLFLTYAEESLSNMQESLNEREKELWRKAAHKLKGSAANLGAQKLSDLCLKAEKSFELDKSEKENMLSDIQGAYFEVSNLLRQRHISQDVA
jgi:hypothetical protein